MNNAYLGENKGLKIGVLPADLNTSGATGERVFLKEGKRLAIVVQMGDSTGATAEFTLRQHDAATSGNSKDLSIDNPYFHKAGAATSFTKVEPSAAAATYDLSSIFAAEEGIVVFEVVEDQLDVENGFGYVSVNITDPAAAKVMGVLYVMEMENKPAYSIDL